MKEKHKHSWEVNKEGTILHCKKCNKISVTNKAPEHKNGCFGKPKFGRS